MDAVEALNAAFKADPNAVHALLCNRVPCNQMLADDQFVIVEAPQVLQDGHFQVGALGLVNAVLAAHGLPLVASKWKKAKKGHHELVGFCNYVDPPSPAKKKK